MPCWCQPGRFCCWAGCASLVVSQVLAAMQAGPVKQSAFTCSALATSSQRVAAPAPAHHRHAPCPASFQRPGVNRLQLHCRRSAAAAAASGGAPTTSPAAAVPDDGSGASRDAGPPPGAQQQPALLEQGVVSSYSSSSSAGASDDSLRLPKGRFSYKMLRAQPVSVPRGTQAGRLPRALLRLHIRSCSELCDRWHTRRTCPPERGARPRSRLAVTRPPPLPAPLPAARSWRSSATSSSAGGSLRWGAMTSWRHVSAGPPAA